MALTVKDDDIAFRWVKEWMLEQEFLKRVGVWPWTRRFAARIGDGSCPWSAPVLVPRPPVLDLVLPQR